MFAHYTPDTSGVNRQKTTPELFLAVLDSYEKPVAWVKAFLNTHGYDIHRVELDPYTCLWRFYSAKGEFVTALSHDFMERLLGVLLWKIYTREQ